MTHSAGTLDELRIVGIPGTNKVMAGELSRLAGRAFDRVRLPTPAREGPGILVYPFDAKTAALAVRYHRTASRVLWSLYESRAQRLEPLYLELREAVGEDPRGWLRDDATISVSAANVGAFAAGARQVVGTVKNALIDGAARRGIALTVDPDEPDFPLVARMHDDRLTISIDLAGRPMNQRGYRRDTGIAPLRENLAAVLVMLARHAGRSEVLLDPLAGSGTIAIEAACMARGMPVWTPPRRPAAAGIAPLASSLAEAAEPLFGDTEPLIVASEIDARAYRASVANAAAAGVERYVELRRGDFRDITFDEVAERSERKGFDPRGGLILGNPPYGERMERKDLAALYGDLGRWCRRFKGWRAAFLVANPDFERAFGGVPRITKPLRNGALEATFYLYDLP